MFGMIRMVAGSRLVILALLAALAAAATPAIRERAMRLLSCGVSLQADQLFAGAGTKVVQAVSGGRVPGSSPRACLREAMRTTTAAQTWLQRRSRAQ